MHYSLLQNCFFFFFFNDTATTEIYTLSLHDALPISHGHPHREPGGSPLARAEPDDGDGWRELHRHRDAERAGARGWRVRSEEHTSELQSQSNLVCRLLLEKKKKHISHGSSMTHSLWP